MVAHIRRSVPFQLRHSDMENCIRCQETVTPRQTAFLCDGQCGRWQHRLCATGVDIHTYRRVVRGMSACMFTFLHINYHALHLNVVKNRVARCRGSRLPLSLDAGCLPADAGARPADGLPPEPWPSCLLSPTSRSAAHATRAHRHVPATTDDRGCHRHPDRVVPVHQGDVGRERRLADKHMVSTQILFFIVGGTLHIRSPYSRWYKHKR